MSRPITIAPGNLRNRVTLQEESNGQDSFGTPTREWVDRYRSVQAKITGVSTRDFVASAQQQTRINAKVLLRNRYPELSNRPDAIANWRIIDQRTGVIYSCRGVIPDYDGGSHFITLIAESTGNINA